MIQYIDRNGRPSNFENEKFTQEITIHEQLKEFENEKNLIKALSQHESQDQKFIEKETKLNLEKIKAKERELLEARSLPLRHYLMNKVIPVLTEGLIEICRELPNDPIDYLSEFLYKNCQQQAEQEQQNKEKQQQSSKGNQQASQNTFN